MKKGLIALALIAAIVVSLTPAALAGSGDAQTAAERLSYMGLFLGTDKGFELDRSATRQEAVTMLVRLLGKEQAAISGAWNHPFGDVSQWAEPYVGYAYENGLTNGTGPGVFGSSGYVTASQYLTFVLRALGYVSGEDFEWDKAWELSDQIGLTQGQYGADSLFLRADAALISFAALSVENKLGERLIDVLVGDGAVSREAAESAGLTVEAYDPPTMSFEDFKDMWTLTPAMGTIWICADNKSASEKEALDTFIAAGEDLLTEYTLRYTYELSAMLGGGSFYLYFASQSKTVWVSGFNAGGAYTSIEMDKIEDVLG